MNIKEEFSNDVDMSPMDDSDNNEQNESDDFEYFPTDTKTPGEILDEFCAKLHDVNTTIPDPVVMHYMKKSGFIANDPKLVKLVSLASQKFISEIINDCMQFNKLKTNSRTGAQSGANTNGAGGNAASKAGTSSGANANASANDKKAGANQATLTLDDLSQVLQDYGINVKKPYYFL